MNQSPGHICERICFKVIIMNNLFTRAWFRSLRSRIGRLFLKMQESKYPLLPTICILPLGSQSLEMFQPFAGHPWCVRVGNGYDKTRLYTPIRSKITEFPRCARHHSAQRGHKSSVQRWWTCWKKEPWKSVLQPRASRNSTAYLKKSSGMANPGLTLVSCDVFACIVHGLEKSDWFVRVPFVNLPLLTYPKLMNGS